MSAVKRVFWNSAEHRLRAVWRLIVQIIFLGLGLGCFGFFVGIIGVMQGLAGNMVSGETPDVAAVTDAMQQPLVLGLSSIITLLAALFSVWLAGRFVDRRPFADFGLHLDLAWWRDLAFGMALGALLMAGVFAVEWALGWVEITGTLVVQRTGFTFLGAILLQVVTYLCVGIYEELFSRGYQLQNMAEGLRGILGKREGVIVAWLLSSSVFGLLHAANPNASLFSTINLMIAGLFLGLGYLLTRELAIPIGLHITWNFFQGNVFGFPVSGGASAVSLIGIEQGGPNLWTGGAFGPEAGLIGLAAIALGSLLIVLWIRWQHGDASLKHEIAEYEPQIKPAEETA
jgi:hypothetical protein